MLHDFKGGARNSSRRSAQQLPILDKRRAITIVITMAVVFIVCIGITVLTKFAHYDAVITEALCCVCAHAPFACVFALARCKVCHRPRRTS